MIEAIPHEIAQEIGHEITRSGDAVVALCAALVAADSAQPRGDTRAAAAVLADWLRARGLAPELRGRVADKPNLVCVAGGEAGRTLGFNGHLDTLPADAGWTFPPLALTVGDGRLIGLGIGNMKAGVAALAVAFAALAKRPDAWRGRLVLTAVADEVLFGAEGAAWLLDDDPSLAGDALLNAEGPGDMGLGVAEKGLLWIELLAEGPPGQGMLATRGGSPIARLADALCEIDAWNDHVVAPPAEIAEVAASAGTHRQRLSVNLGRIEGGTLASQAATHARATIDLRLPPGLSIAAIADRLDRLTAARPDLRWRILKGWDANWTATGSDIARAVAAAAAAVRGVAPDPVVRLPASDASRWRSRGIPAVSYGPQPLLASGSDDWVRPQDVMDCAHVYALAALEFLRR